MTTRTRHGLIAAIGSSALVFSALGLNGVSADSAANDTVPMLSSPSSGARALSTAFKQAASFITKAATNGVTRDEASTVGFTQRVRDEAAKAKAKPKPKPKAKAKAKAKPKAKPKAKAKAKPRAK